MSTSPDVTMEIGGLLARLLPDGAVVHLHGEVGAGKSTLVRGAAAQMGVTGPVTSPTFEIVRRYHGARGLTHVDAHRLVAPDEEDLGLIGDTAAADGLTFVEWPGAAAAGLAPPAVTVELAHPPAPAGGSAQTRLVRLRASDAATEASLAASIADLRARHLLPEPEPGAGGGG